MGEKMTLTLHAANTEIDFTAVVTIDLHHPGSRGEPVPGGILAPAFDVTLVKITSELDNLYITTFIEDTEDLDAFKEEQSEDLFNLIDEKLAEQDYLRGEDR